MSCDGAKVLVGIQVAQLCIGSTGVNYGKPMTGGSYSRFMHQFLLRTFTKTLGVRVIDFDMWVIET